MTNLTHNDKEHQWNYGESQESIPAKVWHDPQCQDHLSTCPHCPKTLKYTRLPDEQTNIFSKQITNFYYISLLDNQEFASFFYVKLKEGTHIKKNNTFSSLVCRKKLSIQCHTENKSRITNHLHEKNMLHAWDNYNYFFHKSL